MLLINLLTHVLTQAQIESSFTPPITFAIQLLTRVAIYCTQNNFPFSIKGVQQPACTFSL